MADYSARTDKNVLDRYMELPVDGKCQAMYVWLDGTGEGMRCKTKTLDFVPKSVKGKPYGSSFRIPYHKRFSMGAFKERPIHLHSKWRKW